MTDAPEEWRPIPGFPGYEVSDLGRVRSWRNSRGQRRQHPVLRSFSTSPQGHPFLVLSIGGKHVSRVLSHLVLLAFEGPRPEDGVALHADRNPANNKRSNLSWGKHEQAFAHLDRTGTHSNSAKLTREQVLSIRASTAPNTELAATYGVCGTTIRYVRQGRTYRD